MPENPRSPRDQFVDDLLDAALREYGRAEARPGLENRILRRLEESPPKRSWLSGWHWTSMGAVGTLAVIALALITYPPEVNRVGPAVPARPGATEQHNSTSAPAQPAVTVPPPNRSPRFNQRTPQSGVRFGGTRSQALPPCTPEQEAAQKKKQLEQTDQAKTPEDCVPASPQQHSPAARPPRR